MFLIFKNIYISKKKIGFLKMFLYVIWGVVDNSYKLHETAGRNYFIEKPVFLLLTWNIIIS